MENEAGQSGIVWLVVGVLLIIVLLVWLIPHFH